MQIFNYKIQCLTAGRISSNMGRIGHRPMTDYYLRFYKCDIEAYKARHDNRKWGLFPFNMRCCNQIWATPLHMNVSSLLPVDVHPLKRRTNFSLRADDN